MSSTQQLYSDNGLLSQCMLVFDRKAGSDMLDQAQNNTRSQGVSGIVDRTASQQTITQLAIVAK